MRSAGVAWRGMDGRLGWGWCYAEAGLSRGARGASVRGINAAPPLEHLSRQSTQNTGCASAPRILLRRDSAHLVLVQFEIRSP
jgi:hypothetical protein